MPQAPVRPALLPVLTPESAARKIGPAARGGRGFGAGDTVAAVNGEATTGTPTRPAKGRHRQPGPRPGA